MKNISTKTVYPRTLVLVIALCCSQLAMGQTTISGQITSLDGQPAVGIPVHALGAKNQLTYTDNSGHYTFSILGGGAYEIRPLDCRQNPLNGVTTYDRVLISQQIMGTGSLSPYGIIAGDMDGNQQLDTTDVNLFTFLTLGIIQELPTDNYKYVLKDYVFPDPLNPFDPPYPGSFLIQNLQSDISDVDFFLLKTGDVNETFILAPGCLTSFPASVNGRVYHDVTNNCIYEPGEPALSGWTVEATNGSNSFFGTTDHAGQFQINLPEGTYDVLVSKPNNLWDFCLDTIYGITASQSGSLPADFGATIAIECPVMEVELSTNILRRCFSNYYSVQYCNQGTALAEDAYIEVTLDPFFEFTGSSIPSTNLGGNKYAFEVGDVPAGVCGNFLIHFILSCEATLGQTHCSEATILPDTVCTMNAYTGADLHIDGECTGNEVVFTIRNLGGDMIEPSNYIVIEDIVVMIPPVQNPFTLLSGASTTITKPANGSTVRLEVEQPADHPWSTRASATVEGCGLNSNGTISLGMVNLFPMFDQTPFVDVDCLENTGSFDPNDKQGMPFGIEEEHFIPMDQSIDYLIRFQNTGTDTAFTVIILDTLSADLSPQSIRLLGSSHPYEFSLNGEGVAQFVFNQIMLPDSNVNEPASHGFVKFKISPKSDRVEGTRIENKAAIYFDFNDPVITNTTWHTLSTLQLLKANETFNPLIGLEVFPNPTTDFINFLLKSPQIHQGRLFIFDLSGHLVSETTFNQNNFGVSTRSLLSGCYYFKIISDDQMLATGKFIKVEK